jgi:hypothetical protein
MDVIGRVESGTVTGNESGTTIESRVSNEDPIITELPTPLGS